MQIKHHFDLNIYQKKWINRHNNKKNQIIKKIVNNNNKKKITLMKMKFFKISYKIKKIKLNLFLKMKKIKIKRKNYLKL